MKKIYGFGYNAFSQTIPNNRDIIISEPTEILSTRCTKIMWANLTMTLGMDVNLNPIEWGFDGLLNGIKSPTLSNLPQNVKKCFGDDVYGIRGFIDQNGFLYQDRKIIELSTKCVDVAQCCTGGDVVGITADGKLWQWNVRERKEADDDYIPKPLELNPIENEIENNFIKVVSGENHFLALTRNGEVYTWGSGRYGQLGHGNLKSLNRPTVIEFLQGLTVTEIACGGWHSAVITDSQDLYTFGWNSHGRLGINMSSSSAIQNDNNNENDYDSNNNSNRLVTINPAEPNLIEFNREDDVDMDSDNDLNVLKVSCGSAHTAIVTDDNQLRVCGWGKYGQQGQGPNDLKDQLNFSKVKFNLPHNGKLVDCICGRWNTFAILIQDES
ncbi:9785_t:CDS:2, partial [Ambispora leptoticha]